MMTEEPSTGYRTVQQGHEVARWRYLLFREIREAPRYREITRGITHNDCGAIERAAAALNLVRRGKPCPWACGLISDDLHGRFDPDRPPATMARASRRVIEISSSPVVLGADTYRGGHPRTDRVRAASHRPVTPMQISGADWAELERLAVEAARQAVSDLRENTTNPTGSEFYDRARVKAKGEADREFQIKCLALRLAGRAGTLNDPRTDRRWFALLGIDPLRKSGKS